MVASGRTSTGITAGSSAVTLAINSSHRRATGGLCPRDSRGPRGNRVGGRSLLLGLRHLRPLAVVTLAFVGFQATAPWNYAQAVQLGRLTAEHREARSLAETRRMATSRLSQARARASTTASEERGAAPVAMATPPAEAAEAVRRARAVLGQVRSELGRLATAGPGALASPAEGLGRAVDLLELSLSPLDELNRQALASFERVGEHLEAAGLPAAIETRHRAALREHRQRYGSVRGELERTIRLARELARIAGRGGPGADVAPRSQELAESLEAAERRLDEMVETPEPPALDVDHLPHRVSQLEPREPRLDPADFTELGGPSVGSATGPSHGTAEVVGLGARATLPTPADLAQTPEVQFTPRILLQAAELGDDPRAIFDFVRNSVEPTPTWGSIQGADACLQTLRCNAMDTASLLIALLRISGIPARYALGTVETSVGEVQGLLGGFSNPRAALQLMGSSGTPVVGVSAGGELVAARFEHVWVEAFVDYVPSRGVVQEEGDTWVPLDPYFKRVESRFGLDPVEAVGFDVEGFLSEVVDGATLDESLGVIQDLDLEAVDAQLTALRDEVAAAAEAPDAPDTLRGLLGGLEIVEEELTVLPGALPYDVLLRAGPFAEVPSELRHRLRFEVANSLFSINPELAHEASLPELAGRRISLSYAPATAEDEAILQSFLPQDETDLPVKLPGYLIQVRPELRADGQLLATGAATALGSTGRFRLRFSGPSLSPRAVTNNVVAGSHNAVVLNLSRVAGLDEVTTRMEATVAQLEGGDVTGLTKGDVIGDLLYSAGLTYWLAVDFGRRLAASQTEVRQTRLLSEGIFSYVPRVGLLFGSPISVSSGAFFTDVDTNVFAVKALDGDPERALLFALISGAIGSRAESANWDALLNETPTGEGITAVSFLEEATRRGIPVHAIDGDNLDTVLPLLQVSGFVERTVRDGVNAGRVVIIPERSFTKDGFQGIGLIVLDPNTGSAAYLISSGLAGGGFDIEIDVGGLVLSMVITVYGSALPALLAFTLALISLALALLVAAVMLAAALLKNPDLPPACQAILFFQFFVTAWFAIGFFVVGLVTPGGLGFALTMDLGSAVIGGFVNAFFKEAFEPCESAGGGGGGTGGGGTGDGGTGDGGTGDGGTGDGGTGDGGTGDGGTGDGGTGDGGTGDGGTGDGGTGDGGTGDGGTGDGGTGDGGTGDGGGGGLPAEVSLGDVVVTEGSEPMLQAVFTVNLSSSLTEALTLDFATADDTATAGDDYQARSGSVTLLAGETSRQIAINVLDDSQAEGDETFRLLLTLPADAPLGVELTDGEGVATIRDDDGSSLAGAANDNRGRHRSRDAPGAHGITETRGLSELREAA